MSDDIGKGDLVECVQNRRVDTMPPIGLVVGRVYEVEAVGITPPDDAKPGTPWVRVIGVKLRPGKFGFRLKWFRRLGPKRGAFDHLLTVDPVKKPEKVEG